jgi:hypothetical protein
MSDMQQNAGLLPWSTLTATMLTSGAPPSAATAPCEAIVAATASAKAGLVDHAAGEIGMAAVDAAVDHRDRHACAAETGAAHDIEPDQRLGLQQLAGAALVGIDRQHRRMSGQARQRCGLDAHRGRRHEREAPGHVCAAHGRQGSMPIEYHEITVGGRQP